MVESFCFSVVSLAKQFPNIIAPDQINSLASEFAVYRCMGIEPETTKMPVDRFWSWMAGQKKPGTDVAHFPVLVKLCQSLCVLPHGNADCERIFSMVRHIKTEFRNQLGSGTEEALLAVGRNALQNTNKSCFDLKIDRDLLKSAKVATMTALEENQKKKDQ